MLFSTDNSESVLQTFLLAGVEVCGSGKWLMDLKKFNKPNLILFNIPPTNTTWAIEEEKIVGKSVQEAAVLIVKMINRKASAAANT